MVNKPAGLQPFRHPWKHYASSVLCLKVSVEMVAHVARHAAYTHTQGKVSVLEDLELEESRWMDKARRTKGCGSYAPQWAGSRLIMGEIFSVVFGSTKMRGGVLPNKLLVAYFTE